MEMNRLDTAKRFLPAGVHLKVTIIEHKKVVFYRSTIDIGIVLVYANDSLVDYIPFGQYIMIEQVLDRIG